MAQEDLKTARDLLEDFELSGVLNDEKKVLSFCCACCRLIWNKLPRIAQDALEVAEKYVKNVVSEQDLANARISLWNHLGKDSLSFDKSDIVAIRAVICCLHKVKTLDEAFTAAEYVMDFCNCVENRDDEQFELLLKTFGNSNN